MNLKGRVKRLEAISVHGGAGSTPTMLIVTPVPHERRRVKDALYLTPEEYKAYCTEHSLPEEPYLSGGTVSKGFVYVDEASGGIRLYVQMIAGPNL